MGYVLVVEDDDDTVRLLCQLLKVEGYECAGVKSGTAALTSILVRKPDLLITDLCLPEGDGAQLIQIVRSYFELETLPVIVYTGVSEDPLAERARQLGARVLTKAKTTPAELLAVVAEITKKGARVRVS